MAHVLYIDRIEEHVVEGRRLGRHAAFDSRSLAYQVPPADVPIVTRLWTRNIPILDQGQIGSCEGNAQDGALGTSPLFEALPAGHPALDEAEAVRLYTEATRIDPFPGSYPGQDTGTDTLSACKAAKADGLTSGYLAALTLAQMQAALMTGPVVVGWNWYDSMDNPDSSGLITISPGASIRGGHALVIRGIDIEAALFHGDNSWSLDWGNAGSFDIGFADVEREFAEQGDCYQPLPAGVAPPVPVPPGPTPPGPVSPADAAYAADPRLVRWAHDPHLMHDNKYAAQQFLHWKKQLGL